MFSSVPAIAAALPMRPPLQELERVHREQEPALPPVALDERVDLLVGGAALEAALDREREHARSRPRRRLGVDRAHDAVSELCRRGLGARERAGDLRRDVEREDPLVGAELVVAGEEIARRRLRGRRKDSSTSASRS